jgi:PLP dependent protein
MSIIIDRFNKIKSNILLSEAKRAINIIAVSKMFTLDHIKPLIDIKHVHFGENKVQEADSKWSALKKNNQNIKLHMIGKLQSNKAKKAVQIFDYIHSLDSQKLADTLVKNEKLFNKKLKYFIQVNLGSESQKSGIQYKEVDQFYTYCRDELNMDILGLMAIPPNNANTKEYFKTISELNYSLNLPDLSLGMTNDYQLALNYNSTFLRIGSGIFGERN